MFGLINFRRVVILLGMIVMPVAVHSTTCVPFEKQVSVDGGITWFDADTPASAPTQAVGGTVEYRFLVKNCEEDKNCYNTSIADPTLDIVDALVRSGAIVPGEEIVVTQTTPGFENLLQPDRCDTPGLQENTATETTYLNPNFQNPEMMIDNAWVNCVAPDTASLGDRVWLDDGDGIQDCTMDADGSGIIGDNASDCTDVGLDGVVVTLGEPRTGGCLLNGPSTITMNGGFYLFPNLAAGKYCVAFERPAGLECTAANILDEGDGRDSDGLTVGNLCVTNTVLLQTGETNLTVDLGLVDPTPTTVTLGDRVWEDLNGNGMQDCMDSNGNGVIGDASDSGAECGAAAVPGVTVNLYMPDSNGDCTIPMGPSAITDAGGFYSFDGLNAGDYCVQFDLSTVNPEFCTTDGYQLGAPLFTTANQGDDDADSDAGSGGFSESVTLAADDNLTLDAGIVCPAKIGDRVWLDTDGDGQQDTGEDNANVSNATVELYNCADDTFVDDRVTDASGMYMFGADGSNLPPGDYYLVFTDSEGRTFTTAGSGDDPNDSNCMLDGSTACFTVGGRSIDLTRDCGVVVPPVNCALSLDKTCRVEAPPTPAFEGSCQGRLQEFTVIWNGTGPVTAGGQVVNPGEEATFTGPFDDNDVVIDVVGSPQETGFSVFHMSCSDDDFDGPEDCGLPAGDGKGNDSDALNLWLLEGFVDADNNTLDCNSDPSEGEFLQNCSFEAPIPPSCDTTGRPDNLTWRYDGGSGDCDASTFGDVQGDDFVCDGSVDVGAPVNVYDDDDGYNLVSVGGEFTISRDASKKLTLENVGGTQDLEIHTSCSQPIEVGLTAGALTLVAMDGQTGGVDVTYGYTVMNNGDDISGISIVDVPLGLVASGIDLASGDSYTAYSMARIFETTSNTATASATLGGELCASPSDMVTVESVVPPCSVSFTLDKVADDALKIKVTNNDTRNRVVTLESLMVEFPAGREELREVKLDGAIYKRDDSPNPTSGNDVAIGTGQATDWTEDSVSKRQLDPGETRTLEIKTTEKSDKNGLFTVTLNFGDDCIYNLSVENQELTVLP